MKKNAICGDGNSLKGYDLFDPPDLAAVELYLYTVGMNRCCSKNLCNPPPCKSAGSLIFGQFHHYGNPRFDIFSSCSSHFIFGLKFLCLRKTLLK